MFAFSCNQDTQRRVDFDVQGIDVSHHQSYINWRLVADQGFHFAFVKATEGLTFIDSLYCGNWDSIPPAGLKRGAYHFFHPSLPAHGQASNFINRVVYLPGDLPPVLDVETLDGMSKAELIAGVQQWLAMVQTHYGIKPIIYTNMRFYNRHLAGHFDDYPLWIARYNKKEPQTATNVPWLFWQYGNRGKLEGIKGYVDFNVFSSSLSELEKLCFQPGAAISEGRRVKDEL